MDYLVGIFEIALIQATLHGCNVSRIYPLVSRPQQSTPLCLDQPRRCFQHLRGFYFWLSTELTIPTYLPLWT